VKTTRPPASRAGLLSSPAARLPGPVQAAGPPPQAGRIVPLGQLVQVRGPAASGELCLLSYAQPAFRGLLTMVARSAGPSRPPDGLYFMDFGAADDQGTSYGIGLHGSGVSGPGEWILQLNPDPPRTLRWLDPVPGQLAALCQYLGVGGHGITAPPAGSLPDRWRDVLIQLMRGSVERGPAGSAAAAVTLPEIDGIRFTILGVHDTADRTVIFMHAAGATGNESGMGTWPAIWVRSPAGWHATRPGGSRDLDGEVTMDVTVMPPLGRDASWIEVIAAGRSAVARVTLPLSWQ
jgi:hypothetical protein